MIAGSDPSLWHTISVPEAKSFRLWDTEFAALVARCKGRLTRLHVSLSGITGKSLIRLIEVREAPLQSCALPGRAR